MAVATTQTARPSLSRIQEKLLDLSARRRIYEEVRRAPGVHLRLLSRDLGMPMGTLEHHLRVLEEHELLCSHREGQRRYFFPVGHPLTEDAGFFHLVRNEKPRRILEEFLLEPELDHAELVDRLPFPSSTVSYHARRLAEIGLLERTSVGRETWYRAQDAMRVRGLLRACAVVPSDQAPVQNGNARKVRQ